MLFDSPAYFIFLIPVVMAYWRLGRRKQNVFLLLASYFFYGWWDWRFLGLMIGTTTIDFLIAPMIDPTRQDPNRKRWLVLSLLINFAVLGIFKYFDFFAGSFASAFHELGIHRVSIPLLHIILPPGISFYTFEEVAYMVDVFKGKVAPAKSFLDYGLFISLFPHLIAGPIQRPGNLLPQVQKDRAFDTDQFFDGLMLIFSGLFRKCVIADNCALLANAAFGGQFGQPSFWVVLIGVYAFAWQVYGDFSGYTDIARGSAQLLGFRLVVNFRQPYLANCLQDFWRRWHISLSTWLRDYLYIPLGGSRVVSWKVARNLMITLVLAGLWHGANWTYVIFGAIQGAVLVIERFLYSPKSQTNGATAPAKSVRFLHLWSQRVLTFNIFCLSLAFFRAASLRAAVQFLSGLSNFTWRSEYATAIFMLCLFSIPLFIADLLMEASNQEYPFAKTSYAFRTGLATASLVVLALLSGDTSNAFIYFQF
ncbi:MAG TPA: MBOAT family O-acyltransferase [Candidatus Acidoferrales bacterium]|nr:MBOAT family O-acyltransferase [Candidatus Acidoferrales bacterium]